MADDDKPAYKIGFKRPPQATRFKPGHSGNPKGRRKGAKSFATAFENELNTPVPITENGKRKKITKREAIVKQVVNKAASGDTKAIPTVLNEARQHENLAAGSPGPHAFDQPEDQLVIASLIRRIRQGHDPAETMPEPPAPESNQTSPEPEPESKP